MPSQEVAMSTTDSIPGDGRAIAHSTVAWSTTQSNTLDAYNSLRKWARDNGWDAVVGLRFVWTPDISGMGGGTSTSERWLAYGTCISYK